jgi:uncharacterized membrane protein YgcG
MRVKILYVCLFVGVITAACREEKKAKLDYVNDNAFILTNEQKLKLTEQIKDLEQRIGSQIVILTINSLAGEKIEDYSLKVATDWGIGRKDYDDGVLITVSVQDRQARIEVGAGLEKIIKDEIAARILREELAPNFREENYYVGLHSAVGTIAKLITDNKELVGQR